MKNKTWSENRIRHELRLLDRKIGLSAGDLPITLCKTKRFLGRFASNSLMQPVGFQFSESYFENENFSEEDARDVIAHEYAHYMNLVLNRQRGHGDSWKACCLQVGAVPDPKYSRQSRAEARAAADRMKEVYSQFSEGNEFIHPQFGRGFVMEREATPNDCNIHTYFPTVGLKTFSGSWMASNCQSLAG